MHGQQGHPVYGLGCSFLHFVPKFPWVYIQNGVLHTVMKCIKLEGKPRQLKSPVNSSRLWHVPQFAAVLDTTSRVATPFVFGGIDSPTPSELDAETAKPALLPMASCPLQGHRTSSEVWISPCDFYEDETGVTDSSVCPEDAQHWRLVGGYNTRVHLMADAAVGETGWPSARSGRVFPLFLRFSIGKCRNCPFFRAF